MKSFIPKEKFEFQKLEKSNSQSNLWKKVEDQIEEKEIKEKKNQTWF